MPSKALTVCVDANVLLSGIAFGGKPFAVLQALLKREFVHVTCAEILGETKRNLNAKVKLPAPETQDILEKIMAVSLIVEPQGSLHATVHAPDNVVLEAALIGHCAMLVTGDKHHLLPLNPYKGLIIESPSDFLKRLG